MLVNSCFATSDISVVLSWTGTIAYALQLFFDFSGYSDMAIGLGLLFVFRLPENFNYPYMSSTITDFYRKWHMSLMKWFSKYIYIPLGESRVNSNYRHIFNMFIVWVVTGIWHGSNFTFIVWAMTCFVFQVIEKYTNLTATLKKMHLLHVYTLLFMLLTLVIFRSDSFTSGTTYLKSMFFINENVFLNQNDLSAISTYSIPLIFGAVFSINIMDKIKNMISNNHLLNSIYNFGLLIILVTCTLILISRGYSAPLYANF